MLELLLIFYALAVWLVFFKLKLLPWNTTSKVIVYTLPILGLIVILLTINVFQPVSSDARVLRHVVQIVPRVAGRVIEVPVVGNELVKKGDVLFRIDPTPYEAEVKRLRAEVADAEGGARALDEEVRSAQARVGVSRSRVGVAASQVKAVGGKLAAIQARLDLAELRVSQARTLSETGAGNRFDLERYESEVAQYKADYATALADTATAQSNESAALADQIAAQAQEAQVRARLSAVIDGELASVARIRAQLQNAEWNLSETVVRAPADGYPVNLQLRPGSTAVPLPLAPAMAFVERVNVIVATYPQNALHQVRPGDEAELTFRFHPGRIFKAKVHSISQATGAGQLPLSGMLPSALPEAGAGRLAVKFELEGESTQVSLPGGTMGKAAIYTQRLAILEIVRKVIIRFEAKLDYIVFQLHLPSH